jgi:uncharacterized repeat protein (TIGR01451 family)
LTSESALRAILAGDYNGDGKVDLAVARGGTHNVTILSGRGTGEFVTGESFGIADQLGPYAMVQADFNSDGKLDIAVAFADSNTIGVLLGDGRGGFRAGGTYPVGLTPVAMVTADFNGDGAADIAVGCVNDTKLYVLVGNGRGSFRVSQVETEAHIVGLAVGEFNGDGIPDLAAAMQFLNSVGVMLGNGRGGFTQGPERIATDRNPYGIAVLDSDRDGRQDLAIGSFDSNIIGLWSGDGSGRFTLTVSGPFGASPPPLPENAFVSGQFLAADWEGNGMPDFAVALQDFNSVPIFRAGIGSLEITRVSVPAEVPLGVAAADFNGDGRLDLATAGLQVNIFLGDSVPTSTGASAAQGEIEVGVRADRAFEMPSGLVRLREGNRVVAAAALSFGVATFATSGFPPGAHTYTADYMGDARSLPSTSGPVTLDIPPSPALAITKKHTGNFVRGQSGATYTIYVSNTGTAPATGAVVSERPPAHLTITGMSGAGWTCGVQPPQCSRLDSLGPNEIYSPITVTVDVSPAAPAVVINEAVVSSAQTASQTAADPTNIVAPVLRSSLGGALAAGAAPVAVAAGDFNGDGKPDLAVADSDRGNVGVFYASGPAGNTRMVPLPGSPFSAGSNPSALAVADFNKDGKPDIAVANAGSNDVTILLNLGLGFNRLQPVAAGADPRGIVAADFNGDGSPDLAVTNNSANNVTILLGNGLGGFTPAATVSALRNPLGIAAGDFNGDGKIDIAFVNNGANNVSVLLGNGAGGFSAAPGSPFVAGNHPESVVVADFDLDGIPDLAVANYESNNVTLLLGESGGRFGAAASSPVTAGSGPVSLSAADFDGDGYPDLAVANFVSGTVDLLLNKGQGVFAPALGSPYRPVSLPLSLAAGDYDGDGGPDLAVSSASGTVAILVSALPRLQGAPAELKFTVAPGQPAPAPAQVAVTSSTGATPPFSAMQNQPWIKVSGNGDASLTVSVNSAGLAAGVYTGSVRITAADYMGTVVSVSLTVQSSGSGGTTRPLLVAAPVPTLTVGVGPRSIALGDLNGDGLNDLAVASFDVNNATLLFGDGKGGFSSPRPALPSSGNPRSIVRADFNGDGKPDLVIANSDADNLSVFFGDGTGAFNAGSTRPATGDSPYALAAADLNGDGFQDLATVNSRGNNVTILLGDGNGGFTPAPDSPYRVGLAPEAIAIGDLDGDRRPDVVTGNFASNDITVLRNRGNGTFAATAFAAGAGPRGVAIGDLDGDGKEDVAVASFNDGAVRILYGEGNGGLRPDTATLPVGSGPRAVAIADLNQDQRLDIVIANGDSHNLVVLLGNGAGSFSSAVGSPYPCGRFPTSIAIGEFNGDGSADVAVANRDNATVSVFLGIPR